MTVKSVADLRTHLQSAIQIEHSTVPLYLYALYSLRNQLGDAAQCLRGVVTQEMLHMSLAANLLTAVGGTPDFTNLKWLPLYPFTLPNHEPQLTINLERASLALVRDVFLAIEHPMTARDVPQYEPYTSIGQFYSAIIDGLKELVKQEGERAVFTGDAALQLTRGYEGGYADAGGSLIAVYDLRSALRAIQEIVREGEGTAFSEQDGSGELAHYWLFNQIGDLTIPLGDTYPVMRNPKAESLPSPLKELSTLFNDCYGLLLRLMTRVFATPDTAPSRDDLIRAMLPLMVRVLRPIATLLVQSRIPGSEEHAGPSFELGSAPLPEILAACERLQRQFHLPLSSVEQALRFLPPV